MIRAASLGGYADLVRHLGGDPVEFVERVGMPRESLSTAELRVSLRASCEALELASEELDCPDLGLRLGDLQQMENLGPLAVALLHAPDLGNALECAGRFLTLHNQGSSLVLQEDPYATRGVAGLRFAWHYEGRSYPQSMDRMLLNVHRVVERLAGGSYGLRSLELSYRSPTPLARYTELFGGVRVNFAQPVTMLRLPRSLLRLPIAGADSAMREMAMLFLAAHRAPSELSATTGVRSAVDALLGSGRTSATWVARHLEVEPRTLQRRLAKEGTTFGAILDEVRQERATTLLAETELSLTEIASMLDLGNRSTLSRLGRRWWGSSPSERRVALRAVCP